ncbi:unnamed protein product [Arctia plantaginis]|uniref:Uncharacterized protein n=1 Tax=Arctia plantaginis TaxID=874455 RepID=A0A8S1AEZ4_ARCPL|nr:unnamed protein product [Arctia plantaginis]CAB3243538.1 unnamed protein product [Arctia plantaginis]
MALVEETGVRLVEAGIEVMVFRLALAHQFIHPRSRRVRKSSLLRGRRYRGGRTLYTGSRAGRTSPTMNRAIFYQLSGGVGAPQRVPVRSIMTL